MNPLVYPLVPLLLAFAVGCQTVTARSSEAPGVNWASYRTFAQLPPPAAARNMPGYSSITGDRIQQDISQQLKIRGLQPADRQSADLAVAIHVSGQPRTDVEGDGGWYGWYGDAYTVHYTEGTLVIDVFDRAQRKLLWHGWGQQAIFSQQVNSKAISNAVDQIMKKFPIPAPKQGS